jgi:hypothetical protein
MRFWQRITQVEYLQERLCDVERKLSMMAQNPHCPAWVYKDYLRVVAMLENNELFNGALDLEMREFVFESTGL